ncbi:two-component sensor histidine kinase [Paenibacillus ferrarius]|uniref:histidine kinase n=1 Tax=Paenibacillus ferrarius TaxID=1469647 RepID=A0A1V4HAY9_9BACL|nr:sensor histidine kinase [Paenibacillus ferrarius]OPH49055.1 two-component sensor histidine kinase [Paenibacillus ferrarius]
MRDALRRGKGRITQLTNRISIQAKLIVAYIVIILIPIILFSWYLFNGFYQNTLQDTLKKNQYMLESEKANIHNNIEIVGRTAQLSIADREVIDYLQNARELEVHELVDFNMNTFSNLQRLMFNNPIIANVRLFTDNPKTMEIWPVIFKESRVAGRTWYPRVVAKKGAVWWEILQNEKDVMKRDTLDGEAASTYVSLFREIYYPSDTHVGILEVDMLIDKFFQTTFSPIQDGESHMLVVDRTGRIFTDTANDFFQGMDLEQLHREWEARPHEEAFHFNFTVGDTPYLILSTPIEQLEAHLLNVVSLKKPVTQIQKARNLFITAAVVLIALLSIITYFLQSLILKKLHILRDSMKKVRRGDLNVHIDMDAGGEVGELAHHFRQMLKKMNELIVEAVNKQASKKEAELNSLKNQIDAHFLYNTLENLKMMAEVEAQYTISDALTSLGSMMRYSLKWSKDHVRLRDEIQHIQNYMAIMNIRYDGMLELKLDIPEDYMEQEVLKMSLQPLIENAVKHGMYIDRARREGITISIRACKKDDTMMIEITDDGAGMSSDKLGELHEKMVMEDGPFHLKYSRYVPKENEGNGIGLRNVSQRIKMYYGREYGITIDSAEGEFTQVMMKLPYLILSGGMSADEKIAYR